MIYLLKLPLNDMQKQTLEGQELKQRGYYSTGKNLWWMEPKDVKKYSYFGYNVEE